MIKDQYSYFFYCCPKNGLGDRDELMKGLRDTEMFVEGEVKNVRGRTVQRLWCGSVCPDICWEGLERKMKQGRWKVD